MAWYASQSFSLATVERAAGRTLHSVSRWHTMTPNGTHTPRWDAKDETLACGLARGLTVQQAAAEAHMSRRTAHRRLQDESFRQHVKELRCDLVTLCVRKLSNHV